MLPFFLVVSNMTINMQQFYMGPEGKLRSIVQLLCGQTLGPKKDENQTFQKKAIFPVTKDFGPRFFSYYRV